MPYLLNIAQITLQRVQNRPPAFTITNVQSSAPRITVRTARPVIYTLQSRVTVRGNWDEPWHDYIYQLFTTVSLLLQIEINTQKVRVPPSVPLVLHVEIDTKSDAVPDCGAGKCSWVRPVGSVVANRHMIEIVVGEKEKEWARLFLTIGAILHSCQSSLVVRLDGKI